MEFLNSELFFSIFNKFLKKIHPISVVFSCILCGIVRIKKFANIKTAGNNNEVGYSLYCNEKQNMAALL